MYDPLNPPSNPPSNDDHIYFKNEDFDGEVSVGPVSVIRGGIRTNYKDHPKLEYRNGDPVARWFTLDEAHHIAQVEGLPLRQG